MEPNSKEEKPMVPKFALRIPNSPSGLLLLEAVKQAANTKRYDLRIRYDGPRQRTGRNNMGWKDTARCDATGFRVYFQDKKA